MKRSACAFGLAALWCLSTVVAPRAASAQTRATSGLQLSVVNPDPSNSGDRIVLDISYRGGTVDTVELYLDKALVAKRQIGTSQTRGMISFQLETTYLTEGPHEALVKAYGADGKVAVIPVKLTIAAADLSAPVRITYPTNGIQVSGSVPIRVRLDPDLQRQKPYVTFFVDRELQVLRNYPPYEYIWDTTRVNNGWHLVEAWTQADTGSPFKARPVNVNVNNPTGETKKLETIEQLAGPKKQTVIDMTPVAPKQPSLAAPVNGIGHADPTVEGARPARIELPTRPTTAGSSVAAEPRIGGLASSTLPPASARPFAAPDFKLAAPAPQMVGGVVVQPKGRIAPVAAGLPSLAGTADIRPAVSPLATSRPVMTPAMPSRPVVTPAEAPAASTVTARAGETLRSVSKRTGAPAREIARLNATRPGAHLAAGENVIVPSTFEVAFDGARIAFDVAPRVEGGIKLAPFRQIFEHTGGRLYWFGGSAQTVRAVNNTREIEIKIGSNTALVNNQPLTMEHKAYIVSGRTIVPLTFVRDALNVTVHYDPASGRLLIESTR